MIQSINSASFILSFVRSFNQSIIDLRTGNRILERISHDISESFKGSIARCLCHSRSRTCCCCTALWQVIFSTLGCCPGNRITCCSPKGGAIHVCTCIDDSQVEERVCSLRGVFLRKGMETHCSSLLSWEEEVSARSSSCFIK